MARSSKNEETEPQKIQSENAPNPVWFKPVMFGFFLLGFIWILAFYIGNQQLLIPDLGGTNLFIGFGLVLAGLFMSTRWR